MKLPSVIINQMTNEEHLIKKWKYVKLDDNDYDLIPVDYNNKEIIFWKEKQH